ncbi:hypothetical protein AAEO56_11725 [Flavobacterium sp. DGU11]|uniref:Uncharacterized protein n=1 Tax=Flavobacterium arundinis TaxID=3139143 RepID=A0ABU9HXP5_9FLAO
MTIEMKKSGERELQIRKQAVDSLYRLVTDSSYSHDESLMNKFIFEKEQLEIFTNNFTNNESVKIWSRISNYAKEFSKQNSFRFILGMQTNENILYGDEHQNVTDSFIKYINEKYEGGK